MSLIDKLYSGEAIPPGTSVAKVKQVEAELTRRLAVKLSQRYSWFAICTVAVEAGMWGGERRVRQRRKLFGMINTCRVFCGEPALELEKEWEYAGLRYGYCVCQDQGEVGMALARAMLGKLKKL